MNNKTNSRILKLSVCMLAMAILTSCLVAGTFAKYSTQKSGADNARVAKFGVVLSIADTAAFEKSYTNKDGEVTVLSDTAVVAPGTSDDGGLTFKVTGQPEVKTHIDVNLTVLNDVFLKDGDGYYRPVVFKLWRIADASGAIEPQLLASGDIASVSKEIDKQLDKDNEKGTVLNSEYQLTWAWAYEGSGSDAARIDMMDTILGDIAAGDEFIPQGYKKGVDYSVEIGYKLTITVTQLD